MNKSDADVFKQLSEEMRYYEGVDEISAMLAAMALDYPEAEAGWEKPFFAQLIGAAAVDADAEQRCEYATVVNNVRTTILELVASCSIHVATSAPETDFVAQAQGGLAFHRHESARERVAEAEIPFANRINGLSPGESALMVSPPLPPTEATEAEAKAERLFGNVSIQMFTRNSDGSVTSYAALVPTEGLEDSIAVVNGLLPGAGLDASSSSLEVMQACLNGDFSLDPNQGFDDILCRAGELTPGQDFKEAVADRVAFSAGLGAEDHENLEHIAQHYLRSAVELARALEKGTLTTDVAKYLPDDHSLRSLVGAEWDRVELAKVLREIEMGPLRLAHQKMLAVAWRTPEAMEHYNAGQLARASAGIISQLSSGGSTDAAVGQSMSMSIKTSSTGCSLTGSTMVAVMPPGIIPGSPEAIAWADQQGLLETSVFRAVGFGPCRSCIVKTDKPIGACDICESCHNRSNMGETLIAYEDYSLDAPRQVSSFKSMVMGQSYESGQVRSREQNLDSPVVISPGGGIFYTIGADFYQRIEHLLPHWGMQVLTEGRAAFELAA